MIRARFSGTVWYFPGNEIPSGRGQLNHVARCGCHSGGKEYLNAEGVRARTFTFFMRVKCRMTLRGLPAEQLDARLDA
jgi:hypothetical protein